MGVNVLVTLALVASTAIDAAAVGACLLWPGAQPVGLRRVLVNLAYVDLVVLLPLLGLAVLVAARHRAVTGAVRALAWASLGLVPVGIWATFVEPARLVTEEATIALRPERAGSEPLRVAVLADIQSCHVTDRLRDAVQRAMDFEPHLILMPGDLMQCSSRAQRIENTPDFRRLLAPLDAPLGVWFVLGNTDRPDTVRGILEGTEVVLLQDETRLLAHGDRRVLLAGADFADRSAAFVSGLEDHPDVDDVVILFAHYPDVMHRLARDSRVDLLVAGHTHGGQVNLPFIGPPVTLSRVPRRVAAGGYHVVDGVRVYVSRGIGCERGAAPRVRFNCPPEVSLLTLE
jgi:predicted MPP superfamily phosphohydrolase